MYCVLDVGVYTVYSVLTVGVYTVFCVYTVSMCRSINCVWFEHWILYVGVYNVYFVYAENGVYVCTLFIVC